MTITYTCVIKKMWRYIFIVVNERKNGNGGKNADFKPDCFSNYT